MKKLFIVLFSFGWLLSMNAQDWIIFRDGQEKECKVIQVNSDKTLCKEGEKKKAKEVVYDNTDIYMIKYEKRGNVFFTDNGDHVSGSTVAKPDKKATLIYLKIGKEIEAFDLEISPSVLRYKIGLVGNGGFLKKKGYSQTTETPKSMVFMIKFPDGTKEILSPFQKKVLQGQQTIGQTSSSLSEFTEPEAIIPQRTYPCNATIKTKQGTTIKAIVLSDDETTISYKRQASPNGPTYNIEHNNIKSIKY